MIAHKFSGIQLELTSAEVIWLHYTKFFMELEDEFNSCMHVFKEPTGVYYKLTGNYNPQILEDAKIKTLNQIQKNKIELLNCQLDGSFYSLICNELRIKFPRVFIQLLPYNVFEQLSKRLHDKFGYKQAFLDYQEIAKKRKRFCYLVCEKSHFNQVKEAFTFIVSGIENQTQSKESLNQNLVQQQKDQELTEDNLKNQQQNQQIKKKLQKTNKRVEIINIHNLNNEDEEGDNESDLLEENFEGIEMQKEDFPCLLESQKLEQSTTSQISSDSNQEQQAQNQTPQSNNSQDDQKQDQQQQSVRSEKSKKIGIKRRASRRLKKKQQAEQLKAAQEEQLKQLQEKGEQDIPHALQNQQQLEKFKQQQQYELLLKHQQQLLQQQQLSQSRQQTYFIPELYNQQNITSLPVGSDQLSSISQQLFEEQLKLIQSQGILHPEQQLHPYVQQYQDQVNKQRNMVDEWDVDLVSSKQYEDETDQDNNISSSGEREKSSSNRRRLQSSSSSSTSSHSQTHTQTLSTNSTAPNDNTKPTVLSEKALKMMRQMQKSEPFNPDKHLIYSSQQTTTHQQQMIPCQFSEKEISNNYEILEEQFNLNECIMHQNIYTSPYSETSKITYKENIYVLKVFKGLSATNLRIINKYSENLRRFAAPRITRCFGKVVTAKVYEKGQLDDNSIISTKNNQKYYFEVNILLEFKESNLYSAMNNNQIVTFDDKIYVFYQLCLGIQHLHQNNIVHNNIKPQNILLTNRNKLTLQDFYTLKQQQQQNNSHKKQQQCYNAYIPENEAVSKQSDIYSVGLMGYYIFTNHLVEAQKSIQLQQQYMLFNILSSPKNNSVSIVKQILIKMLDIQSMNRPDINEIVNTLKSILSPKYKDISPALSLSSSAFLSTSHISLTSVQQ